MGTSKHVAILLTVALTGILMAGQDQPTTPSQAAPGGPSNTRSASCIVRIRVDPTILPLNPEAVSSLIHSPAVLGKALREVLSVNSLEDLMRPNPQVPMAIREPIAIRWLGTSSAPRSLGAQSSPQQEMMRQMEEIYGRAYMEQMMGRPVDEKKGEAGGSSQKDSRPGQEGRSDASGMGAGGAVGGMGGMGMGGVGIGRMGMGTGASWGQEQLQRQPGESDVAYRARLAQIRGMSKMGAGGGMGAMGGMMSEYGGMGSMGFSYGASGSPQQDAGAAQIATFELRVNLPDTVRPVAEEFLKGVVQNLQASLSGALLAYRSDLEDSLAAAKEQRKKAEEILEGAAGEVSPAAITIRKQLEVVVQISGLNPQVPIQEAFELLRNAGARQEPPLNIVVLWNDLKEHLSIEPTSPVNVDGMRAVKLGTALDLLVKGLPAGDAKAVWKIKDDVIVVGTTATLGPAPGWTGQPPVEADVVNLAGQRSELTRRMQALELDLAGLNARQKAIRERISAIKLAADEHLAGDPVTRELENLQHTSEINLANLKKAADAGRVAAPDLAQAQESAARIRIDLARRREELSKQAGGGQLEEFAKELSRLVIDKAEKEAQLQIIHKQLDEVQKQLAQALTFDPEAARLRMDQEALDVATRRVAELQMRLANLQPPMVTMIGAN